MSENPFLLPPGAARPATEPLVAPTEPQPAQDAAPATTPSHYIAVPAPVESATHRFARPAQESPPEPVAEETQVAAPRQWSLMLPDGTRVSLAGPLLLGRDPAGIPDRPDARLLPVADPGKTVSKTHALLEPGPEGVRVRELHSTNGVAIDTAGGRQLLAPGGDGVAPQGATIMLGSFAVRIAG
jgi:hypothetical protein